MQKNYLQSSQRILQIGKYSLNSNGGIEAVTRLIHCNISELHIESLTFRQGNTHSLPGEKTIPPGFTIYKQPISLRYVIQLAVGLRTYRHAIIHLPNMIAALVVLIFGKNIGLTIFWHADILRQAWYSRWIKFIERKICQRARSVIYTSRAYYDQSYSNSWVSAEKAHIIPLGTPAPFFYKQKYRSDNDILKILFIGRATEYKGLDHLIEAVRKDRKILASIVGIDASDLAEVVGDVPNINVIGVVSNEQKQRLIAEHDFLVLPSTSRAEAFGMVLIEALAAGTPIITRHVVGSGMNEVSEPLEGQRVGYSFGRTATDSLSEVLAAAYHLPEVEYKMMSAAAHKKYLRNYTANGFTSAMEDHLKNEI